MSGLRKENLRDRSGEARRGVRAWALVGAATPWADLEDALRDHGTVLTCLFIVSLVLIFLLGFGLRDALQKRAHRLRLAKVPDAAPRRN